MATPLRSRFSTIAGAVALACAMGLSASDANALALGRLSVLSGLGEPLRAEIDIPEINAAEAESLRAAIASPEAYKAAGLEYNPALNGLHLALQKRPDGRTVLRITGDRPVNEPFLDLVLDANWAAGRTVRDYTLLLDPPVTRAPAAVATAPQITPPAAPRVAPAPAQTVRPASPAPSVAATPRPAAPVAPPAPRAPAVAATTGAGTDKGVTVQRGDTASKIAAAYKPASVSLDQMLVALLQANPNAFIKGNLNRIKAGAVLDMPSEKAAAAVPVDTAKQQVNAQSRDFNDYRSKLAGIAPAVQTAGADRAASGRVETQVTDKKPSADAADKLTLSKGAVQGSSNEERIAQENRAKDASTRLAEISKNINELNRIGAASGNAAPANATASAAAPGIPAIAAPADAAASAPAATTSAPVAAVAAADAASAPTTPAAAASAAEPTPTAAAVPAPTPMPEPGFLESLLDNKALLALLGALAVLLAALGVRARAKKASQAASLDSSFLESRAHPDSFFGASGGQRVDTSGNSTTGNATLNYTHSQLDTGGDVDPVAEADVYLAYGRDLQAEEILKEALRSHPSRFAIHAKLMEIYAKRQDVASFQTLGADLHRLTQGQGPEWERVSQLGRDIDPRNPIYQPGTRPSTRSGGLAAAAVVGAGMGVAAAATAAAVAAPAAEAPVFRGSQFDALDLDLDLDLDISAPVPLSAPPLTTGYSGMSDLPGTTDVPSETRPQDLAAHKPVHATLDVSTVDDLEFTLENNSDLAPLAPKVEAHNTVPASDWLAPNSGMIDFDMGSISLDLDAPVDSAQAPLAAAAEGSEDSPLATKLALAQEFNTIGDTEGARSLCEEVIAEATGSLKTRAERLLAELG